MSATCYMFRDQSALMVVRQMVTEEVVPEEAYSLKPTYWKVPDYIKCVIHIYLSYPTVLELGYINIFHNNNEIKLMH